MILLNLYIDEQSADHALQVRLNNTTILLFYLDKLEDKTSEVHDKKNVPLIGKSRKNTHKSGCSRKKNTENNTPSWPSASEPNPIV